jgi:hypothetical protein
MILTRGNIPYLYPQKLKYSSAKDLSFRITQLLWRKFFDGCDFQFSEFNFRADCYSVSQDRATRMLAVVRL